MLYINVYLIGQGYGGPEEGGWYYEIGTPLASIPVDSDYKPGKSYYLGRHCDTGQITTSGVIIQDCDACSGTGEVASDSMSETDPPRERCKDCGLIPENPETVWKLIEFWQDFFKDTPGRHEEIRVSLQEGFAQSFPDRKPHYE